ncbi:hypothetical protein VI817_008841 [Penicillium citrinum]|nr:hypothetical protein VI817_008841 [Penicillium citrinum]
MFVVTCEYHDNGDPCYTAKGRDLNRFRYELSAYHNLHELGVCDGGFVFSSYSHIGRIHASFVHHYAISPQKKRLLYPVQVLFGVDFDVAMTFNNIGPSEKTLRSRNRPCRDFREDPDCQNDDQRQSLPANTKFY